MEQYEALRAKEAEQVAELDTAREEAKAALAAFNDLSTRRYDLFMAAFDHVAAHIDPTFKVRLQDVGRQHKCPAVGCLFQPPDVADCHMSVIGCTQLQLQA